VDDFDVRAAVVVGEERAVVLDTLAHPAHMAGVLDLVDGRPFTVVYTHADWDHAWGTCALGDVNDVVAQGAAAQRFLADVPEELARRRSQEVGAWADVVLMPPTRTFETELVLELGGVTLELHALPGHTPDCIVGFVPQWGVLLAGDTVETPLPVVNDGAAVAAWVNRLGAWRERADVTTVVPSHGPVGDRDLITRTMAYLQALGAGGDSLLLGTLPAFYRETHLQNLERMASQL